MIIDADGHIFEPADMWVEHTPSQERHLALSIDIDELGYADLLFGGRSTGTMVQPTVPGGDFASQGAMKVAHRAGRANPGMRYDEIPNAYWQPAARAEAVKAWGIDRAILYPQSGFVWEYLLADDLDATRVNMAAWNRWAVEVTSEGQGRLQPVGHLSLQGDISWLRSQLQLLSAGGVRMAMMTPLQINGKRMSHPDNDAIWQLFVDYGIAPAWHVNFHMAAVFDNYLGWSDNDTDSFLKVVTGIFQPVSVQIGVCDLAANGVFERFPDLRIVLAEVGTHWLPTMLKRLDNIYTIQATVHGRELTPALKMPPSDYIRRQVLNTCSFPSDAEPGLLEAEPDNFAFGGDWPHPEGLADPLHDYEKLLGEMDSSIADAFYGGNAARILSIA